MAWISHSFSLNFDACSKKQFDDTAERVADAIASRGLCGVTYEVPLRDGSYGTPRLVLDCDYMADRATKQIAALVAHVAGVPREEAMNALNKFFVQKSQVCEGACDVTVVIWRE